MKVELLNDEKVICTKEIKNKKKINEIFKDEIENLKYKPIICKVNNKYEMLNTTIENDSVVEFYDITTRVGLNAYKNSLIFITIMAFEQLFPNKKLYVNYSLHNSMYLEVEHEIISKQDLDKLKNMIDQIIGKNLEIEKITMTRDEAKQYFGDNKSKKGYLQYEKEDNDLIVLYRILDFYNCTYSEIASNTGILKDYELEKYNNGFLIRFPILEDPNKIPKVTNTKKLAWALEEYKDIHKILEMGTVNRINKAIKNDSIKEIIMLDEALHEKKIGIIADKISKNKDVKIVLVAGPSSSGKTTFAQRLGLHLRLNKLNPVTLSVDNYFVERENTPLDEKGKPDFECIEAIDLELFNDHLTKLLNRQEVIIPTFDFKVGHKYYDEKNKLKLKDDQILIIEGIHCLNDYLTSNIQQDKKFKVYISCLTALSMDRSNRIGSTDTRLIRRIVRDQNFRGYSASQTINTWPNINKAEQKNIFKYQESANCIFNSSLIYELCALKPYALPALLEITKDSKAYPTAQRLIGMLKLIEEVPAKYIPDHSLLKEFIGGGNFKY